MAESEREAIAQVLASIGQNLQTIRTRRELTQAELAERASVDTTHVRSIEGGRGAPSLRLLVRLSLILDVDLRAFFKPVEPRARNPGRPRKGG